ncbi:MAG: 8-amino-7-oxononanoate synthase [Myxococcota bacterium]|nr:8-amino-7-oxononanoate synthase [Myxococcota bacterium]
MSHDSFSSGRGAPIAIVGMACRFPGAPSLEAYWSLIRAGSVQFRDIPSNRWNHEAFFDPQQASPDSYYVHKGAFLRDEDIRDFAALYFGIAPRRAQVMEPQQRLLLDTVRLAIQDAGYQRRPFNKARTSVYVGVSAAEYKDVMASRIRIHQAMSGDFGAAPSGMDGLERSLSGDVAPVRAFTMAGSLFNMHAAAISQTFDFGGPSIAVDAACASALAAVHQAVVSLRAGESEIALAGGVYVNMTPDNLVCFSKIGAISRGGACRPYDAKADGFIMGEGVGMVMLKRLDDAIRDGDRVYAIIRGAGCNNDGKGEGPMTPRPEGQAGVVRLALEDARVQPSRIGYIENHGTATTVGDVVEVNTLRRVYEEYEPGWSERGQTWLSSVKANVGHTMAAAGIAGLIKAALVVHHKVIPPQPGVSELNPKLGLDKGPFKVPGAEQVWDSTIPRMAAVSSFGFGGTNVHMILEEPAPAPVPEAGDEPELFLLSAETPELTACYAASLADHIERNPASLRDISFTLALRERQSALLALTASSPVELLERLRGAARAIRDGQTGPAAAGAFFQAKPLKAEDRKTVFLFPGQGAQKLFLLKPVYDRFPAFRTALDRLCAAADGVVESPLLPRLYPDTGASGYDENTAARALTATETCQPVMAALGLACAEFLRALGVREDMATGHSLGEFAALGLEGALPMEEVVRLVARRGLAMRDLPLEDKGAMAAIMQPRKAVEELIAGIHGVAAANFNHPTQTVISGLTAGVLEVLERARMRNWKATRLDVSHAFHSPLMNGLTPRMTEIVNELPLQPASGAAISAITGQPYPDSPEMMREIMVFHASAPVDFVSALETCAQRGGRVWVQMGAGKTLVSMVKALPAEQRLANLSFALSEESPVESFLSALGQLAALGFDLQTAALFDGRGARIIHLPGGPLPEQTYWVVERGSAKPFEIPRIIEPQPAAEAAQAAMTQNPLIELFNRQLDILNAQAEVLKEQARALGQGAAPVVPGAREQVPSAAAVSGTTAVKPEFSSAHDTAPEKSAAQPAQPALEPRPATAGAAPSADRGGEIRAGVRAVISDISGFPAAMLKDDQTLINDLGFDSLMVQEMASRLDKQFPGLGAMPATLFNVNTTTRQIADHVIQTLSGSRADAPAAGKTRAAPVALSAWRTVVQTGPHFADDRRFPLEIPGVMLISGDDMGVAQELQSLLNERGVKSVIVNNGRVESFDAASRVIRESGVVGGYVDLAALQQTPANGRAESIQPLRDQLRRVSGLAKAIAAQDDAPLIGPVFFTISATGGHLSGDSHGSAPLGLAGFARALAREYPGWNVRHLDVDATASVQDLAGWILAEMVSPDRTPLVGLSAKGRAVESLAPAGGPGEPLRLNADSVVMISGGASGLGFDSAMSLAQKHRCRFVLLGRRPAEHPEIAENIQRLRAVAADVLYIPVDIADGQAVEAAVQGANTRFGRVDMLIHSAGVLADGPITSLQETDLHRVFDAKVTGLMHLLNALDLGRLKAAIVYGSWAGRFGNARQTPYSAANAVAARVIEDVRKRAPHLLALTIEWPPWEGSAMANTLGDAVKAMMIQRGAIFLTRDQGLAMLEERLDSGVSGALLVAGETVPSERRASRAEYVDPATHLYLNDHRLHGKPIVPFAFAMNEAISVARPLLGEGPVALEDFRLFHGVDASDPLWLLVEAVERDGVAEIHIQTKKDGRLVTAYRGHARKAEGERAMIPSIRVEGGAPSLPLSEFYGHVTFHGRLLQGIGLITSVGPESAAGVVHGCKPGEWIPGRTGEWDADPLALDSAFQLAGYWAWVTLHKAGFPMALDRFVLLKPVTGDAIRCELRLESDEGGLTRGTVVLRGAQGEPLAFVQGLTAQFSGRDLRAAAPAHEVTGIDPSTWDIEQFSEYVELNQRLTMAELAGVKNPYFHVHSVVTNNRSVVDGRPVINYSSYNYLGLSGDPDVTRAAQEAIAQYGTSVSASRVASGEKPLHRELEAELARFIGTEDCIVMVSGHATNVTVIGHMAGKEDLILHDALAHDSILQGCHLSGAKRLPFAHNDWRSLEKRLEDLRPHYRRVLIALEGVYSMDGDIPDLKRFVELKKKYGAMMLVDEAHSIGVLGKTGRGVSEYSGVNPRDVDMWMGTMSKSLAGCGGYIAGSKALVTYLKYTAPGFVYSVGLSPALAGASLAALKKIQAEPWRVEVLHQRARLFLELARAYGLNTGQSENSAVVPVIVGNSMHCLQLAGAVNRRGVNVQPILYPAVEDSASRLRFFLTCLHTEDEIRYTVATVAEELRKLDPAYLPPPPDLRTPAPADVRLDVV